MDVGSKTMDDMAIFQDEDDLDGGPVMIIY